MYEELVKELRQSIDWSTADGGIPVGLIYRLSQAADAIEDLSKRIDRAVDIYNRNVEKTAMYEVLVGIAPKPPKEETE